MLESSPGCLEPGGEDRGGEGAARGRRAGVWAEGRARLGGRGGGAAVAESCRVMIRWLRLDCLCVQGPASTALRRVAVAESWRSLVR